MVACVLLGLCVLRDKNSMQGPKDVFFLGYKKGVKGFTVLDIASREIFISRNVHFYEHIFPYNQKNQNTPPQPHTHSQPILPDIFLPDLPSKHLLIDPNPIPQPLDHSPH